MIQKVNLFSSLAHLYPGTTLSTKINFLGESDTQGSLIAAYSNFPVLYLAEASQFEASYFNFLHESCLKFTSAHWQIWMLRKERKLQNGRNFLLALCKYCTEGIIFC